MSINIIYSPVFVLQSALLFSPTAKLWNGTINVEVSSLTQAAIENAGFVGKLAVTRLQTLDSVNTDWYIVTVPTTNENGVHRLEYYSEATPLLASVPVGYRDVGPVATNAVSNMAIADAILLRPLQEIIDQVAALTGTDQVCVAVAMLGQLRAKVDGAVLKIYQPDGSTLLFSMPVKSDTDAVPITGMGVD